MRRIAIAVALVLGAGCGGGSDSSPTLVMAWNPPESSINGTGDATSTLTISGAGLPDTVDVEMCSEQQTCVTEHATGCSSGECSVLFGYATKVPLDMDGTITATISSPAHASAMWTVHLHSLVIDCVAAWVKVDLANEIPCREPAPAGSTCTSTEAQHLQVGDLVWTRPEGGGEYGAYPVEAVAPGTAPVLTAVVFEELHGIRGASLHFSSTHQLLVEGKGWTEVQNLSVGDVISGLTPTGVLKTEALGQSPVVQITIAGAHTYETWGVASHDTVIEP